MPKVMSQSNRIYYNTLTYQERERIRFDIALFNTMVHDAYDKLYRKSIKGQTIPNLQKYLKEKYQVNDYLPLSAVWRAKAILKSNVESNKNHIKNLTNQIKRMKDKVTKTKRRLTNFQSMKQSIIELDKVGETRQELPCFQPQEHVIWMKEEPFTFVYKNQNYSLYLFEVQVLDPEIKHLKHRIKMLQERIQCTIEKKYKLEQRMPSVCFGGRKRMKAQHTKTEYINDHEAWKKEFKDARNHEMMITGRAQGRYGNNLFKYHMEEGLLYYIASDKTIIKLPIKFHLHAELLREKVQLPHETKGKAICFILEDHGDYFIMKAVMELTINHDEFCFTKTNGTIGLDINVDHFAIAESDYHGNLINHKIIKIAVKGKTTNQRKAIIREAVKEIFDVCEEVHKPLIIEKLDLANKKQEMMYNRKKRYNRIISEFAYNQISECIYHRSYKTKIGVIEVNPAYTSQIGKLKYMKRKGITIHEAASYVIARRGQGYKERLLKKYRTYLETEEMKKHHWSQWHKVHNILKKSQNQIRISKASVII